MASSPCPASVPGASPRTAHLRSPVGWQEPLVHARAALLLQAPGVRWVSLNRICGTVSVSYDPERQSVASLRDAYADDGRTALSGWRIRIRLFTGMRWLPLLARLLICLR
jgi:hypothetical protein